jgi:hypothetical protein
MEYFKDYRIVSGYCSAGSRMNLVEVPSACALRTLSGACVSAGDGVVVRPPRMGGA